MRFTLKGSIKLLFVVVAIGAIRSWQQQGMAVGQAPPLNALTIRGEHFSLDTPRETPLVIHFWASWCPICKLEEESIASIAEDYPVITIAMQSGTSLEVEHYLEEQGIDPTTITDPDGTIAHRFGVQGVPTSYIVDQNNKIQFSERGYTTELGLRSRIWLTQLIESR